MTDENRNGEDDSSTKHWDKHPDMDGILRAIDNSHLMTEDIAGISNYSLQKQMMNHANFTKVGLTTADKVHYSITDQDHFPYTRRYRGEVISDDPIIMDRLAGFRPVQDAAYACAGISTGIANLTGTVGDVCGAPVHRNSLGVGASEGNFETNPEINVTYANPIFNPDYSSPAQVIEGFQIPDVVNKNYPAVGYGNVRDPSSHLSVYPTSTVVAGGGRYARVPFGSVGGRTTYPRTQFQSSCKMCNFLSASR